MIILAAVNAALGKFCAGWGLVDDVLWYDRKKTSMLLVALYYLWKNGVDIFLN